MTLVIRRAGPDDTKPLAKALARAFADDPMMSFLLPDEHQRRRRLPMLFALQLRSLQAHLGEVYTTSELSGAALWAPPGRWRGPPLTVLRGLPRLLLALGHRLPTALRSVAAAEEVHPSEPHWYLAVLGTEPASQGRGVGSALLAPVLQRCDADGVPAYLESSKQSNVAFYARHGFEVTSPLDIPGGGPRVWPMWREPRP